MRHLAALVVFAACAATLPVAATAQPATASPDAYPAKAVRVIVGFAPGGATDIVARVIAQRLGETWGQPVTVENRPGAGGNIASELVARAEPDGYTLLVGATNTHTINQHMYAKMPIDPLKDMVAITSVAETPMALVVHPSIPVKTVAEFVAFAKSRPGKLTSGSAGTGSAGHLSAEMFKSMAGVDIVHVPYKGAGPAVTDLLGGQIQAMFAPLAPIAPHVRGGKLNLLAVTTARRSEMFPEVPTIAEAGISGFEVGSWFGFFAPVGTPQPVIDRVHQSIVRHLKEPDTRQKLSSQALEPVGNTPQQFAVQIRGESERFGKLLRDAGVKPE